MAPVPVPTSLGFVEGVAQPLEKRFEVLKDVGDGSFGSVVLARVRGTRNTVRSLNISIDGEPLRRVYFLDLLYVQVAIKSMKKPFDSFSECLRLREVQVRTTPNSPIVCMQSAHSSESSGNSKTPSYCPCPRCVSGSHHTQTPSRHGTNGSQSLSTPQISRKQAL